MPVPISKRPLNDPAENAEAACVALVLGVIAGVVAHEDASPRHAVAVGDEFLGRPVQIEGMLAGIEKLILVQHQLRHPLRKMRQLLLPLLFVGI